MPLVPESYNFWYLDLFEVDMQMRSSQEAMATHASVCGTLTASVLSASSLCSTRLARSLSNLLVVAGERDPVFCEQWGSHRDKDSATTNTDTLNNLNMAHLQASAPLTRSEPFGDCTCIELDQFFGNRCPPHWKSQTWMCFFPALCGADLLEWIRSYINPDFLHTFPSWR